MPQRLHPTPQAWEVQRKYSTATYHIADTGSPSCVTNAAGTLDVSLSTTVYAQQEVTSADTDFGFV